MHFPATLYLPAVFHNCLSRSSQFYRMCALVANVVATPALSLLVASLHTTTPASALTLHLFLPHDISVSLGCEPQPATMAPAGVNVVLGAAGATGLECVKRLLAVTDAPVRAVVRDPAKYPGLFPHDPRLQVRQGKGGLLTCQQGRLSVRCRLCSLQRWASSVWLHLPAHCGTIQPHIVSLIPCSPVAAGNAVDPPNLQSKSTSATEQTLICKSAAGRCRRRRRPDQPAAVHGGRQGRRLRSQWQGLLERGGGGRRGVFNFCLFSAALSLLYCFSNMLLLLPLLGTCIG